MSGIANYFRIEELVPQAVFLALGRASIELISPVAFTMLNQAREILGVSLTVNNWFWGGNRQYSGFRPHEYYTNIADYLKSRSQHKYGRAFDFIPKGMSTKDAIKMLIENHHSGSLISFIEIDRDWVHIDCRQNRNGEPLVLWSPDRGYVTIGDYLNE